MNYMTEKVEGGRRSKKHLTIFESIRIRTSGYFHDRLYTSRNAGTTTGLLDTV
jgi:hypothetical protein